MSMVPKHFGLKPREESYMFKELEKVRQERKLDFLRFHEKRFFKPASEESPVRSLRAPGRASSREKRLSFSCSSEEASAAAEHPATSAVTFLREALVDGARLPGEEPPLCHPPEFYLRSSAFLRYRSQKKPPGIASQVGTARPVVLLPLPPRAPLSRASRPAGAHRLTQPRARDRPLGEAALPRPEPCAAKVSIASSTASEGDTGAGGPRKRVRICSQPGQGAGSQGLQMTRVGSKPARELGSQSEAQEVTGPEGLRPRKVPESIEEIITSLQSEAQLASDQTIRELIESILGQSYDIEMQDISLTERTHAKSPQGSAEAPQMEAEPGLQMTVKEPKTSVLEEVPEAPSSIFHSEQDILSEWTVLEAETTRFKSQETSEIFTAEDSNKLLEDGRPKDDSKAPKIPHLRSAPQLHQLCTTAPAQQLPVDLHLASRIFHTADKKGHSALLGVLGPSFLSDLSRDVQRRRLLHGVPAIDKNQECVSVPPIPPGTPPEMAHPTRWHGHKAYLQLLGQEMFVHPGLTKLFWNPAAPKFAVPESIMKETLYPKYERTKSAVELSKKETVVSIKVEDDTQGALKEMMLQKATELEHRADLTMHSKTEKSSTLVKKSIDVTSDTVQEKHSARVQSLSLIEASKRAGISYIIYPKKKKPKKGLKWQKLRRVCQELSKPPRGIERSTSLEVLPGEKKYLLKVPLYERPIRCPSLPVCLNIDKLTLNKREMPENYDSHMWALETFMRSKQKTPAAHAETTVNKDLPEKIKELRKIQLSDSLKCNLPLEAIQYYESEVEILTEEIKKAKTFRAFAYCRRGAIYRKLGKFQSAMNDLQEAIRLEPLFLNAYWHRHLIYLFQDRINDALDDLNYITKYNKNNADAYLSKAEIYRANNNTSMAILNYTQAIKCKPTDADMYFRRGEMYEQDNRVLAADDFSKCILYDPQRTDALMKRGIFHYENENWTSAIQDFTALLNIDHQNSEARTYRGKAYFKKHLYKQATWDFSFAVHFDPNNWLAFYYRACIFRKSNPLRALQDYSTSVLINDSYENVSCFLHRGILYAHLKFWFLAICDFETVIALERTFTLAYINIGLIHMLYLENYTEAICQFSEAIRFDPLCIQSYICKAEAYYKLHKWKMAVKELSRAIHLQPDGIQLHMIRGQYLLLMKYYDLAKFTIYQVAEMNKGHIDLTPVQQALIFSFLENHDKAIQILEGVVLSRPEVATYALLAKAQMKAKRMKEAEKTFKKALEIFSYSDKGPDAVAASADCLYHLGLCYMEEGSLHTAFDYFTKAVKASPDFAEGFYQRGLCKAKLQKENLLLDFNRAIHLNPKHYQAYLSRVAFFGLQGRYSKAILNCNEAIKIYPDSVRAYLYRGVLKYYSKSYELAIADLTIVVNKDKNNYVAFYNRALCYTKIRQLQLALIDYGIVLLLNPGVTVTLNTFINRGLIYTELEQYGFALEDFKQAAVTTQTNVSLFHAAAICHHRIREYEEAVRFFTEALRINPCFQDAYVGRGNSYMEYGCEEATKQAQKDFLKALHLNPVCIKARISLGYNLQALGKFQKSWNHFTVALEVDPKSHLAWEGRAVVCLQMGNNFAAMQDMNAAIKIRTTAEFLTNRGVIHEFMGQELNAMKDYQASISLDPKYSLAYFNAGNIYFHHRQYSQASDYFSKALKIDPENEYVLMNRAIVNIILKKYEEAKEDFACIVELCPYWAAIYFNRAHLYCCLKQYELAEEDLCIALSLKPNDVLAYHRRAEVRGKMGLIAEAMADYNQALDLEEHASVP
ncbi:tetratricopeptide repeat protein 6 [Ctenodactylus gundi]